MHAVHAGPGFGIEAGHPVPGGQHEPERGRLQPHRAMGQGAVVEDGDVAEVQRIGGLDCDCHETEEGHEQCQISADRPQQRIEDQRHDDGADPQEHLGSDPDPPEKLHGPQVGGRGYGILWDEDPAADQQFLGGTENDGDQVQSAGDSGVETRGYPFPTPVTNGHDGFSELDG